MMVQHLLNNTCKAAVYRGVYVKRLSVHACVLGELVKQPEQKAFHLLNH